MFIYVRNVFIIFFNTCFTESLFIPIEGWLSLLMTCHWTISFPSPLTLLLWKVSTLCKFDPSYCSQTLERVLPSCFSLLTRGTCSCGWVTLTSSLDPLSTTIFYTKEPYRNIIHSNDFLCQTFVCRWWHQNQNKLPGRGVRAQTSFWVPHTTFPQWGQQSMERYVGKHIKHQWCF